MTTIYTGDRGSGRTKRCIEHAAETWSYIVCRSHEDAYRISQMAQDMDLDIPFPITFEEFAGGHFHGRNIKGFVIDDLDALVAHFARGVPVKLITWLNAPTIQNL